MSSNWSELIYRFAEYLKTQCPTIKDIIYAEGTETKDLQNHILIREGSGGLTAWPLNRTDSTVQVISYHRNRVNARDNTDLIYQQCRRRYNFELPPLSGTTGGAVLPIAKMEALQPPYYAQTNDKGQSQYVNNYVLTYLDPMP